MRLKILSFALSLFSLFVLPALAMAQDAANTEAEKGLDQRINDGFAPVADWWFNFIFTPIPIEPFNPPIVLVLLVFGALFFTLVFWTVLRNSISHMY